MKTSEIMLGDYVNVHPSNLPIKVASIHKGKVGYHARTDKLAWVRAGLLRPIPLTPEILEKNGFTLKEEEKGMYGVTIAPYYTRDDVPFEVFCDGEPFAIWFKDPVNIKYVHQLQHALRLCGIDKTIEL